MHGYLPLLLLTTPTKKVGGATETEVQEKKDRVVDALNATRAAVEEGIVPGGGKALLWASMQLESVKASAENVDQKLGVEIVERAIRAPLMAISKNAGTEGAVVCGDLLKAADEPQLGYNAQTGEYVNMMDAGIIDPAKVVRTAIVDASSIASLMMTAEAMVADEPEPEGGGGGGGMPPGMGGMGGMGGMPGMM
jgi:chaperonin GroEL